MRVHEIFRSIQGEGYMTGVPMTFIRLFGCSLNCPWCLGGKSKVTTVEGKVNIEDLNVGDEIIGWDGVKPAWTTVRWVGSREVDSVFRLEFDGVEARKVLFATAEHPFFVIDKGWVEVQDLVGGDVLLCVEPNEVLSLQKRKNNPMWDSDVAARSAANKDYRAVGCKISEARRASPEILEASRRRFKRLWRNTAWRQVAKKRMRENNPMFDPKAIVRRTKTNRVRGHYKEAARRLKELWNDPGFRKAQVQRMRQQNPMFDSDVVRRAAESRGHLREKSGQEQWLERLALEYDLEIEFVGDFQLPIGDSEWGYRFPDFQIVGQKKVIETYSPTFKYLGGLRGEQYEQETRRHYARFGWQTHFVVCDYVRSDSVEERRIVEGLAQFIYNGLKIKSVRKISGRYMASALHSRWVWNVRCEPYSNFFVGPGVLSHNCDTPQEDYQEMTPLEIVAQVQDQWACITGGEPTIHEELPALVNGLRERLIKVAIETNGTMPLPRGLDWVCVSPKSVWPDADVLVRANEIKLLVGSGMYNVEDAIEICKGSWLVQGPYRVEPVHISLQPVWGDDYEANLREAIELCQKHQVRLSVQMHKWIGVK